MSQKNKLGRRIIELRKAKNWSQSELAAKTGFFYAQIGRYVTKGAQPPAEVLKKMADILALPSCYAGLLFLCRTIA